MTERSQQIMTGIICSIFLACTILINAVAEEDSAQANRIIRPPSPPAGWTDGYVLANGIRIHYWRTGGDKPVMLMAHGSSDDGLCWTNLAKELEADYDIIMPDARGHGLSDPPSKTDAADAQAEDLAGLIAELKLDKPIMMGHSMGSSSVAWFAAKYPEIPRAVILEDPRLIPRPGRNNQATLSNAALEKRRAHILKRNNMTYEALVAECMKNNPKWGRSECEIWAPSKRLHHPNNAFRNPGNRPAMSELFGKITVPTLILKADTTNENKRKNQAVADILKNGTLVHIAGAGHNVRREQKALLLQSLKDFLRKL